MLIKRKCLAEDCLHEWFPRQAEAPPCCPRCQRPYDGQTVPVEAKDE